MQDDPIVKEVRQAREAFAARHNYDLKAMAAYLRKKQEASGRKVISLTPKRIERAERQ